MITMTDNLELISAEHTWMAGFDAAIYESVIKANRYGQTAISKLGLWACGSDDESKQLPPYCRISVEAASSHFERGVIGLQEFVGGYRAASSVLREKTSTGSQSESGFTPEGAIGKTVGLSYRTEANL